MTPLAIDLDKHPNRSFRIDAFAVPKPLAMSWRDGNAPAQRSLESCNDRG